MKKTYETLEVYKVCFNANEQVAAAACQIGKSKKSNGNKYTDTAGQYCTISDIIFGTTTPAGKYGDGQPGATACTNTTYQVSSYL